MPCSPRYNVGFFFFFLKDPAPTEIYPLPLPDALPILARLPHRLGEPHLLEDLPELRVAVGVEELEHDRHEVGDLALVVLELKDLRVPLELVEVVDRAHRELAMQVLAHRGDPPVVDHGLLEELPPLRRDRKSVV